MKRLLAVLGIVFLLAFSLYGGVRLASDVLTEEDGVKAAQTAHPFVKGAASVAEEKLKETLKNTPDEHLEKDAEFYAKKLYPIAKGAIKGQLEAILKDSNRDEVPKLMHEAGKDVSRRVIKPFAEGLAEGSKDVIKDLNQTLQSLQKFAAENPELIESVTSGLKNLHQTLKEHAPPPPPLPGFPPFGPFRQSPGLLPHMRDYQTPPDMHGYSEQSPSQPTDPSYENPPQPYPGQEGYYSWPSPGAYPYYQYPWGVSPDYQNRYPRNDSPQDEGWSRRQNSRPAPFSPDE